MSYTALYRKYRPNNFENVVGQDVIVKILRNSIINNHISHAYLFAGPRGTGKTSVAKIFAHAVNCQNFTEDICDACESCNFLKDNDSDIVEIDAASNNGVEEIRTIRDNVKLLPTFCKYKIYIIDEVHMLSTGAFNALLKTLEEPPSHVIFILATTDPNKIPVSVLSRCQRFDFNKIDNEALINRLKYVLHNEDKLLTDEVIQYIAKASDGGLRDAINLLDQILSLNNENVTIEDVDKLSGKISIDIIIDIFKALCEVNYIELLNIIDKIATDGKSYNDLVNNMLIFIRDCSINNEVSNYFDSKYAETLSNFKFNSSLIVSISKVLNELLYEMKYSNDQKVLFEIYSMHLIEVINNSVQKPLTNPQTNIEIKENINNEIIKEDTNELVEENKVSEVDSDISKLKEIRINNVLYGANKDELKKILEEYDRINDFISNKIYNTLAALLLEGKIVVASKDYLLFSFLDESYVSVFDSHYKQIELFLNEVFNYMYKVVAISDKYWAQVKESFILNKKNNIPYVFIEENDVKLEVSDNLGELENSALNIFGEDTISVK